MTAFERRVGTGLAVAGAFLLHVVLCLVLARWNLRAAEVQEPPADTALRWFETPPLEDPPPLETPELPPVEEPLELDALEATLEPSLEALAPLEIPSLDLPDVPISALRPLLVHQDPGARPVDPTRIASRDAEGPGKDTADSRPKGPRPAEAVEQPPRERFAPSPKYPYSALSRRIQGEVRMRLLIDEHGRVQDVEVEEVIGHPSFREAAVKSVKTWRFEPAIDRGEAVSVWARKTIEFRIDS